MPSGGPGAIVKPAEPQPDAPQPVVVMPELVHFENAPYPAEAQQAGVQGTVVLKLTVDKEGNVTAADVLEPAGHGFDEAAKAAALKFKFKPATRDGVPFAVKIKYGYVFELKVVEAPPPPPPTTGELDGALFIAGTETPLAGAEIHLGEERVEAEPGHEGEAATARHGLDGVAHEVVDDLQHAVLVGEDGGQARVIAPVDLHAAVSRHLLGE